MPLVIFNPSFSEKPCWDILVDRKTNEIRHIDESSDFDWPEELKGQNLRCESLDDSQKAKLIEQRLSSGLRVWRRWIKDSKGFNRGWHPVGNRPIPRSKVK